MRGRDTQKTQHGIETGVPARRCRERRAVETLRKPSTGLKLELIGRHPHTPRVETLRKPSTGLKQPETCLAYLKYKCRDTQKTQHGIETLSTRAVSSPSTERRDTQKTQHGIETKRGVSVVMSTAGRDTQKTQHGIETS